MYSQTHPATSLSGDERTEDVRTADLRPGLLDHYPINDRSCNSYKGRGSGMTPIYMVSL
jgi:hypothetical protein